MAEALGPAEFEDVLAEVGVDEREDDLAEVVQDAADLGLALGQLPEAQAADILQPLGLSREQAQPMAAELDRKSVV